MTTYTFSKTVTNPSSVYLYQYDTVSVLEDVTWGNSNSSATIYGYSYYSQKVQIDGAVISGADRPINMTASSYYYTGYSTVGVGSTGHVIGNGTAAITIADQWTVRNAGEVSNSNGIGVEILEANDARVYNNGSIFGEASGVSFTTWGTSGGSGSLDNYGTISTGGENDGTSFGGSRGNAVYANIKYAYITNRTGEITSNDVGGAGIAVNGSSFGSSSYASVYNYADSTISAPDGWGISFAKSVGSNSVTNYGTITGGSGAITGGNGSETIANHGTIKGAVSLGAGNDYASNTGIFDGSLSLGSGNDTYVGGSGRVYNGIDAGAGVDHADFSAITTAMNINLATGVASYLGITRTPQSMLNFERATGGSANDTLIGNAANNILSGNGGNDSFDGAGGDDTFYGGSGSDTVLYTANTAPVRIDLVAGTASFPTLTAKAEYLYEIENATTGSGSDVLVGNSLGNTFRGGAGADRLQGGGGADILIGGAGADVFAFTTPTDSSGTAIDILRAGDGGLAFDGPGAAVADRIDLSAIDANTAVAGNQTFFFGTSQAAGRLWAVEVGNVTHIRGNIDADAVVEIDIAIEDGAIRSTAYTAADFVL